MPVASDSRRRRSIRLPRFDYSTHGAYFVTICAQDREHVFGNVVDGVMVLNDPGKMVQTVWDELPDHYPGVGIDAFVIMPNHVHGIIVLTGSDVGAGPRTCPDKRGVRGQPRGVAPTMTLPQVVHRFKLMTTTRYRWGVEKFGWPPFRKRVWQRNYYERIIRDDNEWNRIRDYVTRNPAHWADDENHPGNWDLTI